MKRVFYGVVMAPYYEPQALQRLKKRRELRVPRMPLVESAPHLALNYRHTSGGVLIQE